MADIFVEILDMSFAASWLIVVVLMIRFLFGKAPKNLRYVLWAMVGIRLLCPFSIESAFSLIPSQETIEEAVVTQGEFFRFFESRGSTLGSDDTTLGYQDAQLNEESQGSTDDSAPDMENGKDTTTVQNSHQDMDAVQAGVLNDRQSSAVVLDSDTSAFPSDNQNAAVGQDAASAIENFMPFFAGIWAAGMAVILIYALGSFRKLRRKVAVSIREKDRIWICDEIPSPFILGIIKPRIYMPSTIDEDRKPYIVAHEMEHLKYHDNVWKPLGFLILAVHWFNPLVWTSYICLCRDIEFACDERVIRGMDNREKKNYMESLLLCSSPFHFQSIYSVAFGEMSIRKRIMNVLHYKKPAAWILGIGVIVCAVVAVCFMTNPEEMKGFTGKEDAKEWQGMTVIEKYFLYKEEVLYETTADLNHDGIEDLVQVIADGTSLNGIETTRFDIQIFLGINEWRYKTTPVSWGGRYAGWELHVGNEWNGAYALVEKDGRDYLLYASMSEWNGTARYLYDVIDVNEYNKANAVERMRKQFACDPFYANWDRDLHREDTVPKIQKYIAPWIENGRMLVYTDEKSVYVADENNWKTTTAYFDEVWNRSDAEKVAEYEALPGTERWQKTIYRESENAEEYIAWIENQLASDFSEWFTDYNGEEMQQIHQEEEGNDISDLSTCGDIMYHEAQMLIIYTYEDIIRKMMYAMADTLVAPPHENISEDIYCITDIGLNEQPLVPISDNMWLIRYIDGYYAYEGVDGDGFTFEERLLMDDHDVQLGTVSLPRPGEASEYWYILMKHDGVFRLERMKNMMEKTE